VSRTRAIWKFPITDSAPTLDLPADSSVLHFALQGAVPTIWVLVDPTAPAHPTRFRIVGTGQEFTLPVTYHGTMQMPGGLVWHLLEESQ
jgi:hypothetical protein